MDEIQKVKRRRRRYNKLLSKPLHILLQDYKVIFILTNIFFMSLMIRMWVWFEHSHATMDVNSAGAFSALALACMGCCKWAMEHSLRDDYDSKDGNN